MTKTWAISVVVMVECADADDAMRAVEQMSDVWYTGTHSQNITSIEITSDAARWVPTRQHAFEDD